MAEVTLLSTVGTCVAFAAARAADPFGATEYAALTWVPWDGITQIGDLGGNDSLIEVTPTCDGIVRKVNGPRNNGSQSMEAVYNSSDPCQILVIAAFDARTPTATRLTLPNGDILYYPSRVLSAMITPGSASDVIMIKPQIEIDGAIETVLAA